MNDADVKNELDRLTPNQRARLEADAATHGLTVEEAWAASTFGLSAERYAAAKNAGNFDGFVAAQATIRAREEARSEAHRQRLIAEEGERL